MPAYASILTEIKRVVGVQIVVVIAGFLYFDEKLAALVGCAHSVYKVVELADDSKSLEKLELFK
jgi:hypothetical protein